MTWRRRGPVSCALPSRAIVCDCARARMRVVDVMEAGWWMMRSHVQGLGALGSERQHMHMCWIHASKPCPGLGWWWNKTHNHSLPMAIRPNRLHFASTTLQLRNANYECEASINISHKLQPEGIQTHMGRVPALCHSLDSASLHVSCFMFQRHHKLRHVCCV